MQKILNFMNFRKISKEFLIFLLISLSSSIFSSLFSIFFECFNFVVCWKHMCVYQAVTSSFHKKSGKHLQKMKHFLKLIVYFWTKYVVCTYIIHKCNTFYYQNSLKNKFLKMRIFRDELFSKELNIAIW